MTEPEALAGVIREALAPRDTPDGWSALMPERAVQYATRAILSAGYAKVKSEGEYGDLAERLLLNAIRANRESERVIDGDLIHGTALANYSSSMEEAARAIAALQQEREGLRKACEPFVADAAAIVRTAASDFGDDENCHVGADMKFGQVRALAKAAALHAPEQEDPGGLK